MRRLFAALVLLLALAPAARAQAPGAFARIGLDARALALSNALVADAHASPYYNPALAPLVQQQHFAASVAAMTFDRQLQTVQFAAPLRPRAGVAVGLVHGAVTGIDGRDDSGNPTGELRTDEFQFFLAFGLRFSEKVTAGASLQVFRADYYEELTPLLAFGIDLGLTYRATENLAFGLAVEDLLARYSWETSDAFGLGGRTTSDRFPIRVKLGGAYTLLDGRLRLLAEVENRLQSVETRSDVVETFLGDPVQRLEGERLWVHDLGLRAGAEYRLADAFALRAGLHGVGQDALSGTAPTAGFLIEQPIGTLLVRAEYGFQLEPYGLGTLHMLTLRVDV